MGIYVCKFVCQFVGWGLYLLLGLSVCWLGLMFATGFVCDNIISFNSRDGVSVGLFLLQI